MPCFLCNHNIIPTEACGALEFAGDEHDERGRYAVHRECLRPEWRKRFVTREELMLYGSGGVALLSGEEAQPELAAQQTGHRIEIAMPRGDIEGIPHASGILVSAHSCDAVFFSAPRLRDLLARFFTWGARKFAGGEG